MATGYTKKVKYIAAGFEYDVNNLLEKFVRLETFDFALFASLWRDAKFPYVFWGRRTEKELNEFTQEIFQITIEMMLKSTTTFYRVGYLFLLYSLYQKQPQFFHGEPHSSVKIRLAMEPLKAMRLLLEFAAKEHHNHIVFVIYKLFLDLHAFHFVAVPHMLGPLSNDLLLKTKTGLLPRETDNAACFSSNVSEFAAHNANTKQTYCRYVAEKQKLKDAGIYEPNEGYEDNFVEEMDSLVDLLQSYQVRKDGVKKEDDDAIKVEDIGLKRAQLKKSQFEKTVQGTSSACAKVPEALKTDPMDEDVAQVTEQFAMSSLTLEGTAGPSSQDNGFLLRKSKKRKARTREVHKGRDPGRLRKQGVKVVYHYLDSSNEEEGTEGATAEEYEASSDCELKMSITDEEYVDDVVVKDEESSKGIIHSNYHLRKQKK